MGLNSDIREIAVDAARQVVREELKQRELARATSTSVRLGPEPLLTVDDVAKLCSVTPKTIQRWVAKGVLRATRNPGMREYRIARRDYEVLAGGEFSANLPESDHLDREATRVLSAALSPKRRR